MKALEIKRSICAVIFLGLLIFFITPAFAQKPGGRFDLVRKKIEGLLVTGKIPAISVGVAQDGKIIWEEGFGFADLEKKRRAGAGTVYNIGSTSKPITATAVMMLAEQDKIRLDISANNYLPAASPLQNPFGKTRNATVRQLLSHTSGLSRHSQMFIGNEIGQIPQVEETIRRYGILTKPAGEIFEYSNLGYGVLSLIVSRTSNQPFGDFLKQKIFLPLAMKNSSYGRSKTLSASVAAAYGPGQKPVPDILSDTPGAADIYSSVHDLLLFGMFHLDEKLPEQQKILNASTFARMKEGTALRGISKYGLGWESLQVGKYTLVYHHGSNGYGTSIFMLLPEKRICISILSNITTSQTQPLADDILKILVPDYEESLNEFRRQSRPEESRGYQAAGQYLGHWKGKIKTWKEEIPVEMWFKEDGDIHIQMKGQYRNLLNGVRFEGDYLRGSFWSDIGTSDANRHRYNLHLKLKLREDGNVLGGSATSSSIDPAGNVLSSWMELEKQK